MTLTAATATTTYRTVVVDGLNIFYREAGPKDAPTLLLLHGFPSSSRMFDTLIPLLAAEIHLLDAGHFALDEAADAIAGHVRNFLARKLAP